MKKKKKKCRIEDLRRKDTPPDEDVRSSRFLFVQPIRQFKILWFSDLLQQFVEHLPNVIDRNLRKTSWNFRNEKKYKNFTRKRRFFSSEPFWRRAWLKTGLMRMWRSYKIREYSKILNYDQSRVTQSITNSNEVDCGYDSLLFQNSNSRNSLITSPSVLSLNKKEGRRSNNCGSERSSKKTMDEERAAVPFLPFFVLW